MAPRLVVALPIGCTQPQQAAGYSDKIKVVISLAVLFLLVILSGCVTQPEKTSPILDNKKSSQPISITAEYTEKKVTLSIERTDGGKLPQLEAVLIDQTGKTVSSDKVYVFENKDESVYEVYLGFLFNSS